MRSWSGDERRTDLRVAKCQFAGIVSKTQTPVVGNIDSDWPISDVDPSWTSCIRRRGFLEAVAPDERIWISSCTALEFLLADARVLLDCWRTGRCRERLRGSLLDEPRRSFV